MSFDYRNKTGIYKIVNKTNNKFYYGSAAFSFGDRWSEHISALNTNKHPNRYLQAAWNKYGKDNFNFSIVLLCDPKNCLYYEQLFLKKYWDNCDKCYNILPTAGSHLGVKRTEETRKKISESNKGKTLTAEHKKKLSEAKIGKYTGENNPLYGRKLTKKQKNHLSNINSGKKASKETKIKMSVAQSGKNNGFYGKTHTPETKRKISETKLVINKEKRAEIRQKYAMNKYTQEQLAEEYHINRATVRKILKEAA